MKLYGKFYEHPHEMDWQSSSIFYILAHNLNRQEECGERIELISVSRAQGSLSGKFVSPIQKRCQFYVIYFPNE